MSKHIKVNVLDEGYDIYAPREGQTWGYRYGPSIIVNDDRSIDAYFAAPGACGEWDWFTYRHSDDAGRTWSNEKVVLQPTPDSLDFYSVCDPGVIKFGEYYYIGYTSTIFPENGGVCNNGFVARSKRPDGPYEKWNGNGWGGRPSPIVYYDEDSSLWGAGEMSFTEVNGKLFIYYTWTSKTYDGVPYSQTRVAVADSKDENWPKNIEYIGVAFDRTSSSNDSADVIYVEDFKKFVAITTDKRFSVDSMLAIYESDDGLRFKRVNELKTNIGFKCHNSGISGGKNKCVKSTDLIRLGYAYGDKWGYWGTRFHEVKLSLTEEPDLSDSKNNNIQRPVIAWKMPEIMWPIAITSNPHHFIKSIEAGCFKIDLCKVDTCYNLSQVEDTQNVRFYDYDKTIISISGIMCTPLKTGSTFITAEYAERRVTFLISIRDNNQIKKGNPVVIGFKKVCDLSISLCAKQHKHIRGMAIYDDMSWMEIFGTKSNVTYTAYDNSLISIDDRGIVRPLGKTGETNVSVTCNNISFNVKVTVTD